MGNLMKKIYLLFPPVLLVIPVSTNTFTMAKSAAIAIVAAVAVGLLNNVVDMAAKNEDRADFLTFGKIPDALEAAPEAPSPWPWPAAWQVSSPAASP